VYGPDFSNVKFTDKDDVGLNVGVTIGYNFNRRLSVNTGFLYTKKNYTTSGENYKFPPGYWAGGPNVKMHSVEASCYMFDIPLNLRYNVVAAKKYSIFASAGLSSYLMSKRNLNITIRIIRLLTIAAGQTTTAIITSSRLRTFQLATSIKLVRQFPFRQNHFLNFP
jgi:hypothetical protein